MTTSPIPQEESTPAPLEPMPRDIHNVYLFDSFNTASWSVVLTSPMLLFLQHLDASATIIAIAASLSPTLNILQIPAARFVERVGYRRFVLSGWTTRSFLVIGMTIVAFLPQEINEPDGSTLLFISPSTQIGLMLGLLLIYNILRGISVCGMLPWFTHIVPESRRGEFLARDQSAIAFSSIISLCFFGLLLAGDSAWYTFGIIFAISAVAAFVSLYFLRRIPDVPVEKIVANPTPMPWKEMFFYPPFFKYLRYNVIINLALGASNAFWVRYFHAFLHISGSDVLFISGGTSVVLVVALMLITPVIDRTSNKQVLTLSGILLTVHYFGWCSVAAGIFPASWTVIIIQAITAGFGLALWNLANVRMVMGIIPAMGRPHFLALYSVASNLTLGLVPLLWGPVLDYLENWQVAWGYWNWNSYSLLYCTLSLTIMIGVVVLQTLDEPKKMTWEVFMRELLVKTPSRALSRIIGRLRGPGIG